MAKPQLAPNDIITPVFRANYCSLFEHKIFKNGDNGGYRVEAVFHDEKKLDLMRAMANKVAKEKWPNGLPRGLILPFKDGSTEREENEDYAGKTFMTFKSVYPVVVKMKGAGKITDESEIYNGIWGRAIVSCRTYKSGRDEGVTFYLGAFQKTKDDEPWGFVRDYDFGDEDEDETIDEDVLGF